MVKTINCQTMNKFFLIVLAILISSIAQSQGKFFTKSGKIEFSSKAPLEDIEAKNNSVTALLDSRAGTIQFSVMMKGFEFDKALMQEHFNDNYVESHKYPKSEFKGVIVNNTEMNYGKEGTYNARIIGKLTIHGVTKDIETFATLKVDDGEIEGNSSFSIKLSDYNVKIPRLMKDNISNNVKITVKTKLQPLKT